MGLPLNFGFDHKKDQAFPDFIIGPRSENLKHMGNICREALGTSPRREGPRPIVSSPFFRAFVEKSQVNYEIGQVPPSWPGNDVCKILDVGYLLDVALCAMVQVQAAEVDLLNVYLPPKPDRKLASILSGA